MQAQLDTIILTKLHQVFVLLIICMYTLCPVPAWVRGMSRHMYLQAECMANTVGLQLGWGKMLRSLRNFLIQDRPGFHSINLLNEREVEKERVDIQPFETGNDLWLTRPTFVLSECNLWENLVRFCFVRLGCSCLSTPPLPHHPLWPPLQPSFEFICCAQWLRVWCILTGGLLKRWTEMGSLGFFTWIFLFFFQGHSHAFFLGFMLD